MGMEVGEKISDVSRCDVQDSAWQKARGDLLRIQLNIVEWFWYGPPFDINIVSHTSVAVELQILTHKVSLCGCMIQNSALWHEGKSVGNSNICLRVVHEVLQSPLAARRR